MTTPWPIDKQYPGQPEHGDTVRVRPPGLYPPLPAEPRRVGGWKIALILSIGLLSAFGAGVGLVWLWGRFVMSCS
jgi:hypothetical protein